MKNGTINPDAPAEQLFIPAGWKGEDGRQPPLYTAAQVAALTAAQPAPAVKREFTNELGNSIRITVEGPNSMHENIVTPMEAEQLREALNEHAQKSAPAGVTPACLTCNDHGAVGNILTAEPCPDCTPAQPAAPQGVAEVNWWEADGDKYDASISPMQPAPMIGASTHQQVFDALDGAHDLGGPPHERIRKLVEQRKSPVEKVFADYPALPKAVTRRDTGSLLDKGRAITLLREYVDADRAAHSETFLHASYYKWLREQHWSESQMFVVTGGRYSVKLCVDCPSGDRLDAMIAEAIAKEKEKQ